MLSRALQRVRTHAAEFSSAGRNQDKSAGKNVGSLGAVRSEVLAGVGDDAALVLPPMCTYASTYASTDASTDTSASTLSTSSGRASLRDASPPLLVQTIDYFRSFVSDPYLLGQVRRLSFSNYY